MQGLTLVLDGRCAQNFFLDIWNMGFRAIDRFLSYVPAFILLRIASYRK